MIQNDVFVLHSNKSLHGHLMSEWAVHSICLYYIEGMMMMKHQCE